jgi:hypothetical protein
MSKFDEALETYTAQMTGELKLNDVDAALLKAITKGLGPTIYRADASKVSCSDKEELERVKKNFLRKKLDLSDDAAMDSAIQEVCQQFGSSNRNKYRAVFYYLLVKKFKKEGLYR